MTKALSEIFGFGQPATPMTPAEKAAEREQKKKKREELKKQQAATRERRQEELGKKREAEKKAKEERHDATVEKRGNRQVELARQNASGAVRRANAAERKQKKLGGVTTRAAVKRNRARVKLSTAKTATAYRTAANSARYHHDRVKANLQKASTEYDMSTVEIISESCMLGLNEDMYFKVKIEGLPTMYVNSANREELRKDLVGLLRNPSKAVGNIKRVTPQEVKKRLRLRAQGKEEEDMNESESVEINEDTILNENIYNMLIDEGYSAEEIQYIIDEGMWDDIKSKVKAGASNISKAVSNVASNIRRKVMNPDKSSLLSKARTKLNLNAKPKPTVKKPTPKPKPKLQNRRGFTPGKQAPENRLKNQRSNMATAKPAPAFKPKPIPKNVSSGAANIIRKVQARQAARAAAKESVNEARTLPQIVSVVRDGIVRSIPSQDLENHEGMGWRHIVNPDDHKGIQAKQTKRAESVEGKQVNNRVPEAVSDIMLKLKDHYTNESKAYYAGLSPSTAEKRKAHFNKHGKKADDNNSAYKPAPGDATAETKPSIHTKKAAAMGMGPTDEACWDSHKQIGMKKKGKKMVPNCVPKNESYNINENKKGLQNKAEKSGMPLGVLKQVYNRGMAAWKTGHRPGTTPEQWGMARVNSFITKSSGTWGKADKDLAAKVKK